MSIFFSKSIFVFLIRKKNFLIRKIIVKGSFLLQLVSFLYDFGVIFLLSDIGRDLSKNALVF